MSSQPADDLERVARENKLLARAAKSQVAAAAQRGEDVDVSTLQRAIQLELEAEALESYARIRAMTRGL